MIGSDELKRLIQQAIEDPRREPAFLAALLDARLYVHLPLSDDLARVRLICFTRPDGLTVIPVFSDVEQAVAAARSAARVCAVSGRELFKSAPGATFMLDPNDVSTTLYPEEIRALLQGDEPAIAPRIVQQSPVDLSPIGPQNRWVADLVIEAVRTIESAEAVHLAQVHIEGVPEPTRLLAVVAAPLAWSERIARAVAIALKNSPRVPDLGVDLSTYDPGERPAWTSQPGLSAIWVRGRVN